MLPLKRVCPGAGPSSCASTETGKLSGTAMVFGSWPKIITPELAIAQFGVSAERIRQIEQNAFKKLRSALEGFPGLLPSV